MEPKGMRWEQAVLGLFEDLEQQAEGMALAERAKEVGELSVAEYASVPLASRLHASVGEQVRVLFLGGRRLEARLARVGAGWVLVEDGLGQEWVVALSGVASIGGLSERSVSQDAWPLVARLTLRTMLRRIAGERDVCVLHLVDGTLIEGVLGRVGEDFVEVHLEQGATRSSRRAAARDPQLVPTRAIAGVQGRA